MPRLGDAVQIGTACAKREAPSTALESSSSNRLWRTSRPLLASPALLLGWVLLRGLFLWLGFGLCFRLRLCSGWLLRRFFCGGFGSRRPRCRGGRLRLFLTDDQLFLFSLYYFATEFVVFF